LATEPQKIDALRTEHLRADLRGRSVRGGVLTLTSQGAQFALQTISTVVLARLLTPADFGMVAMVTAVIGIAHYFADVGLSEATIQREEINHHQVSTLFWINVAVGLFLTCIGAAMAPVLAWFYSEPRLMGITLLIAVAFLVNGLRVQHDALLKRQMRYRSLAIRDVFSAAVAVLIGIALAWQGAGYWAAVALPLAMNFTQMVLSWWMSRWIPSLPRRGSDVRSMLVFGGNLAASYLTNYLNRCADNVLIGWYWGAGPLGLYSRAYNLLILPLRQLQAPLTSVAMPAFSRIQNDPERYARYYLRTANLIMWISAPISGFLFVAADPIVILMLGNQWIESASVFKILAISALAQPLFDTSSWLFVSRGQSGRLLKRGLLISPFIVGSFVIGLPFGIKGVALSYSLTLLAIQPWVFKMTFQGTNLTLQRLCRALFKPVSLCIVAVLVAEAILDLAAPEGNIAQLFVAGLAFAAVYGFSAVVPPMRKEILSFQNILRELRPATRAD